jgi:transcriptional regulator with XRE-family HTH domain
MPSNTESSRESVGSLVREWRSRRRRSQMDVALAVGVSPRHMSFVETGRSRPSPATLLAMAEELDVPLRERNRMLLAAGFAPRFAERAIDGAEMASVRGALQRLLDAHQPFPGIVLDRHWNVVLANSAAQALVSLLPPALFQPALNIFRAGLHPEGLAAITHNFDDWGRYLLRQLARLTVDGTDAACAALEREVLAYPNVQALLATPRPEEALPTLLVPCVLTLPGGRVSMFTTLTTFGTPRDVTLEELCVELFYPSDEGSASLLRQAAEG